MAIDRTADLGTERDTERDTECDLERDPARGGARMRRNLWRKLKGLAARLPFEDLLAAYYCAFDRQTPRQVQIMLAGALAYFILPFDAVPDFMPLIGYTDDAAVLATAIRLVASHILPEHREAARAALRRGLDEAGA
ncbi:MAG: DUF1232 domain-containing protein [Xanthobacteraceae bacterium]|nr:MAG: DUF1232 domain-containing protein [Xanthobacteraceae bacterium]